MDDSARTGNWQLINFDKLKAFFTHPKIGHALLNTFAAEFYYNLTQV